MEVSGRGGASNVTSIKTQQKGFPGPNRPRAYSGGRAASTRAGSSANAQHARSERRVSFAQTVEVWDVASNTALERAAARAESELAQAAARQEVAAAVGVDANEGSARGCCGLSGGGARRGRRARLIGGGARRAERAG